MYKGCTIHVQRVYTLNDIVNKVLNDIIHEIVYKRQDAFGSPRGGKLCCLGVLLINMANLILPKSLRARERGACPMMLQQLTNSEQAPQGIQKMTLKV